MADYEPASEEVIDLANELIATHHLHLEEVSIGLLFRTDRVTRAGATVLGAAKRVPPDMRTFIDHDALIWFSLDFWQNASPLQRRALVDHELCHLGPAAEGVKMRPHDLEEFTCIVERYGIWKPDLAPMAEAFQPHLLARNRNGGASAVDREKLRKLGADFVGKLAGTGISPDRVHMGVGSLPETGEYESLV